jgi:hypothetical protein
MHMLLHLRTVVQHPALWWKRTNSMQFHISVTYATLHDRNTCTVRLLQLYKHTVTYRAAVIAGSMSSNVAIDNLNGLKYKQPQASERLLALMSTQLNYVTAIAL